MTGIDPTAAIHPTAVVAEGAIIGAETTIGPYCVVGSSVRLGQRNRILSHVVLDGHTTIGDDNTIYQFASVGAAPQDLKYRGEPSELLIGNKNIIREYATLQPGTEGGGMKTVIGDQNLFMACSHVGHDGQIGSRNIFANAATLAGHVTIGNGVVVGGLVAVHQFVRIGDLAMIGGGAMVAKDIAPFCTAQGDRASTVGLNTVGLQRAGISDGDIKLLRKVYRLIFVSGKRVQEALAEARSEFGESESVNIFLNFIAESERGIAPARSRNSAGEA